MDQISEKDWKLFRENLPKGQEINLGKRTA